MSENVDLKLDVFINTRIAYKTTNVHFERIM